MCVEQGTKLKMKVISNCNLNQMHQNIDVNYLQVFIVKFLSLSTITSKAALWE